MTTTSHKTRPGSSVADLIYEWACEGRSRKCESGLPGQAGSHQIVDLAGPALTQAVRADGQPVKRAKRARSPQGRVSPSNDEVCSAGSKSLQAAEGKAEKDVVVDEPATTDKELLSPLESCITQLEASTRQLHADVQQLQAATQAIRSQQRKERRRHQGMMRKWNYMIQSAGLATGRLQALQEDGRRRALAHVGITSGATAPNAQRWGIEIIALVDDWQGTYETELIEPQKKELTARFGRHFVSFLMIDKVLIPGPRHTLSLDMPSAERSFIMEAIDDMLEEAMREGARIAYLSLFGSRSWEEEQKTVKAELAA